MKKGLLRGCSVSGEGKEHLLEANLSLSRASPEVFQIALPPHASAREQNEAVAKPLGVTQLMNGKQQRPIGAAQSTKNSHDLARLFEVEPIEWFVDHKQRLWRQQPQGKEQSTPVSLGEGSNARLQDRREGQLLDRTGKPIVRLPEKISKQRQHI